MKLSDYIKNLNPKNDKEAKLLKFFNSYQYKISQQILGTRIRKGLSEKKAAEVSGLDLKSYLRIEQAQDMKSSRNKYLNVLFCLENSDKYKLKPYYYTVNKKLVNDLNKRNKFIKIFSFCVNSPSNIKYFKKEKRTPVEVKSNVNSTKVQWISH